MAHFEARVTYSSSIGLDVHSPIVVSWTNAGLLEDHGDALLDHSRGVPSVYSPNLSLYEGLGLSDSQGVTQRDARLGFQASREDT